MPKRTSNPGLILVHDAGRVLPKAVGAGDAAPVSPPSASVISQVMAEMGRRGGRIGGKRRLETLTPRRRRQLARLAARARWAKKTDPLA